MAGAASRSRFSLGPRDTPAPMALAAFGYWGVGFVGGWLSAFPLGWGAGGLWWGLALGLRPSPSGRMRVDASRAACGDNSPRRGA
jgi:hypothetical protein